MDAWQSAQSWVLFTGVAGCLGAYYYFESQRHQRPAVAPARRRADEDARERDVKSAPKNAVKDAAKKRKVPAKEQPKTQEAPSVVVQQPEADEKEDQSNRQFAEQMAKARKGADLSAPKNKDNRVKTVKQGSAQHTPVLSSDKAEQAGVDADDDLSPAASPALNAGDVSDMLEPASKGPSTLRLTPSNQPQKERVKKQPKEEVVESKKARQNRQKKEQQRLEREEEEKSRKQLEEKQRRAAREARGEPAKNGIPTSKSPTSNVWTAPKSSNQASDAATHGSLNGPLLDTFDAESTASSNGGMDASTAATSTTDRESSEHGQDQGKLSEDEQVAQAIKQSEDESGWTTVAVPPKKGKKVVNGDDGSSAKPVEKPAPAKAAQPSKSTFSGKLSGFQALNDEGGADDVAAWEP